MKYNITKDDLKQTIDKISFREAAFHHSGKVRESFVFDNEKRAIVVTDRVSAFDFILGTIPFKGQVLNQLAAWWFNELTKIEVPHHLIDVPHSNVSLVKSVKPLPVEIVVRGYLTGTTTTSSWYAYQNNDREISGIVMPEGMKKNEPFENPIITPTTKPEVGHDMNISKEEILNQKLVSPEIYKKVEEYALKMFLHGQKVAKERGLILVDTKYEMGLTNAGELLVIDEVHTPDSSRYWVADSYEERLVEGCEPEGLDKEFVRRMIVNAGYDVDDATQNPADFLNEDIKLQAAERYLELFTRMTGETLTLKRQDFTTEIKQLLKTI